MVFPGLIPDASHYPTHQAASSSTAIDRPIMAGIDHGPGSESSHSQTDFFSQDLQSHFIIVLLFAILNFYDSEIGDIIFTYDSNTIFF